MSNQRERAAAFAALHKTDIPLVLYNIWDAGSARATARAGARAIATGSWSVAAAHGYDDGERLPLEVALATLREIVAAVDLPVTIDLEAGYGRTPDAVAATATQALESGAVGCNLEDRVVGEGVLYAVADQSARLRAARGAADALGVPAYINARTDLFLTTDRARHDQALLDAALARAEAYAEEGASGLFAPGLIDERLIAALCRACPLPVNILVLPNAPSAQRLASLGVARISYGPGPYRVIMRGIEEAARRAYAWTEE